MYLGETVNKIRIHGVLNGWVDNFIEAATGIIILVVFLYLIFENKI